MASLIHLVEDALDLLDFYDYLYPLNYEEEKAGFFNNVEENREYNPRFEYRTFTPKDQNRAARLIQDIKAALGDDLLADRFVAGLKGRKRIIEAIGSTDITGVSREIYGFPDAAMVEEADNLLNPKHIPDDEDGPRLSAEQLREVYHNMFDLLGMDYDCTLVEAEAIRNHPRKRTIMIPENGEYGIMQAKRVLIHESTHSVRTHNGIEQNNAALIYGTQGYQVAEEGLPTFNESQVGVFDDTLPRITSRVIAINNADLPFFDLYQMMREKGLDQRLAFIRTYRVKRGLQDTAQPGGFIKDHIYFQGYSILKNRPELADALYIGKVSVEDMDTVPELQDRSPAIPRSQHLEAYEQAVQHITPD